MTLFILWLVAVVVILYLWRKVSYQDRVFDATAEREVWHRHTISDFTARASRGKP